MTNQEIIEIARQQSAEDVGCRACDFLQNNNVMVGISDNLSGIEKYNVYIDGEWKIFEYDYKNARLISPVKKLGIKSGAHTLVAKIEDACGNLTEWEWKFRVR